MKASIENLDDSELLYSIPKTRWSLLVYLESLLIKLLFRSLNPSIVYVGILKYLPAAKLSFHLLSWEMDHDNAIRGEKFLSKLLSIVKLSWSTLTPSETPNLSLKNLTLLTGGVY